MPSDLEENLINVMYVQTEGRWYRVYKPQHGLKVLE